MSGTHTIWQKSLQLSANKFAMNNAATNCQSEHTFIMFEQFPVEKTMWLQQEGISIEEVCSLSQNWQSLANCVFIFLLLQLVV
jgi:hypothetical protein